MAEKITCAVVLKHGEGYTVDNLIVMGSVSAIDGVMAVMGLDYLIPVDPEKVQIGDSYVPEEDIFTRDGERVYPELSDKERLAALEQDNAALREAQNDIELALIELAATIQ